ncbi:MAG TPA: L-threonylcarbamoyladenylate synthase [Pyrinomonadaceae bacterium]|nr:L-threonylcarbamoyladenylate synthase [Pyrinomonadaceae bacterium]
MILPDNEVTRRQAANIIAAGGVIAFRTDTFYGLGADPLSAGAVQKIRELKGREDTKPILLLISDANQVDRFITGRTDAFHDLSKRFWPGPLTLVAHARAELPVELTAGTDSIGLRLPDDQGVAALVAQCGGALTATSANISGREPARTAAEVKGFFPVGIDLIVDSGEVAATKPSTVVDVAGQTPRMIREGVITQRQLFDKSLLDS